MTGRWEDELPAGVTGILVTRYRPRGLPKMAETWSEWISAVAPSEELHAAVYGIGKSVTIPWEVYKRRYLAEMAAPAAREEIRKLAERFSGGEAIMLMCSSACERESRCHRSLLRELILGATTAT